MADQENRSIAFFAHERGDARVRKRIAAFSDEGWKVLGFTFHRERDKEDVPPTWENIHLGTTYNRRYFQRLWAFAMSVVVLWRNGDRLAECGVIYAVNTDNALLALLSRFFCGSSAPLILELADIQPAMTGGGVGSKVFRMIERFVLKRSAILVTTSPGFVREYFEPMQKYDGEVFLLENKVYPSSGLPAVIEADGGAVNGGRPWIVGCFGAFRCERSLELMRELALRLEGRVRFVLRGYPAGTLTDEFDDLLGELPNLEFNGPYSYPDDLAGMYGGIDFSWAFDESDPSGNSAWLLPNRIYEGGCFGVPSIAGKKTETGRWIEQHGLGWTFEEPFGEGLYQFFEKLSSEDWKLVKAHCASQPREDFCGDRDYQRLSERFAELARS